MAIAPSPLHVGAALSALYAEGVIACPTEAVWGLSCDPGSEEAICQLLELKRRPVAKGLILVAANERQLEFLLHDLEQSQRQQLSDSWPGPNTWLIPHRNRVSPWVHGQHESVAVRVSAHPVVKALCEAWGGPLVSSSANPAGAQPARHAWQVRRYFGQQLDYLMPGALGGADRPSEIRDLATGRQVRV